MSDENTGIEKTNKQTTEKKPQNKKRWRIWPAGSPIK